MFFKKRRLHLYNILQQQNLNQQIILDGGVKLAHLEDIFSSRVDGVVVGTGIFHQEVGTEAALKQIQQQASSLHNALTL